MTGETLLCDAKEIAGEIIEHRHWLHRHAETGFELSNTIGYVRESLEKMGYEPVACGKAGIIATVGGKKQGGVFLLRADMDALPIKEESDVDFSCPNGNMHACGHDMHTAMLLGAARLLKMYESEIHGTVKLMFQPAEELLEGAKDMVDAGVLKSPDVDAALMIHVTVGGTLTSGSVVVCAPGISAPAADYFSIKITGKSCHGSMPQNGVDALSAAAHVLTGLQEISARELGISDEAVMTVGSMHAGTAGNVIADKAIMEGTVRCFDDHLREVLKTRMDEISNGIAGAFRAEAEVSFGSGCPTMINDKALSKAALRYTSELLGERAVFLTTDFGEEKATKSGGSEDFAYISHEVPSVMLTIAAGETDKGFEYSLHHPKVRFDDSVLPLGSAVYAWNALRWLGK